MRYHVWEDFGNDGQNPDSLNLEYIPNRVPIPQYFESNIQEIWGENVENRSNIFDAPGFNLLGVNKNRLKLGPARYKHYFVRRLILSGEAEDGSDKLRSELRESIHLLSSMVGVVTEEKLLIGIKEEISSYISLPGSGYLDREMDMSDGDDPKPIKEIISREVIEEINIEPDSISCLGVFEDTCPKSHLNPAIFSIVSTELSPSEIRERAQKAEDSDEFSQLIFIPINGEVFSSLIDFGLKKKGPPRILPDANYEGVSHKTLLMLLLIGRAEIGTEWFTREYEQQPLIKLTSTI